jgi:hypothetical protein
MLSAPQSVLLFLLKEHKVIAVASLTKNLLFEICSSVDILLMWNEMKHQGTAWVQHFYTTSS